MKSLLKKLLGGVVKFVASSQRLRIFFKVIINRFPRLKLWLLQMWMLTNHQSSAIPTKSSEDLSPRISKVLSDLKQIIVNVKR